MPRLVVVTNLSRRASLVYSLTATFLVEWFALSTNNNEFGFDLEMETHKIFFVHEDEEKGKI